MTYIDTLVGVRVYKHHVIYSWLELLYSAQNWVTLNLIEILCVNALLLPGILTVPDLRDLYSGHKIHAPGVFLHLFTVL